MFLGFLPAEDRERHPTYWAICRGVADDDELLELAGAVPGPQLPVNVFLAAVHDLLLAGADHRLAHRYDTVCEVRGLEHRAGSDDEVVAEFAAFCESFHDEVAARCAVRATQTNEVGRCAVLRAVLCSLGARGAKRVGLVDLGCSAGLNLLVDAYGYEVDAVRLGPPGASPVISVAARGVVPLEPMPLVTDRVGVDLEPVDLADPDASRWLLACVWPDDLTRFERLRAAVDVARSRSDVVLVRGDMVDTLAAAAARVDPHSSLVVTNCWSAVYLEPVRRRELAAVVCDVSRTRDVTWVVMEPPVVAHDLGVLSDDVRLGDASAVCVTDVVNGAMAPALVAATHPHGAWLEWLGDVPSR